MFRFLLIIVFVSGSELNKSEELISSHPSWSMLNDNLCGITSLQRIINGQPAVFGHLPWIARLGFFDKYRSSLLHFRCGGSLINKNYILSAAHCYSQLSSYGTPLGVRLGEYDATRNPDCWNRICADPYQDFIISKSVIHENFDSKRYQNDIALFRLNKPVKFSDFIKPICIPTRTLSEEALVGLSVEIAGWGIKDSKTKEVSQTLLAIKAPIVKMELCHRRYWRMDPNSEQQLCIGGEEGRDTCNGDSGGPAILLFRESVKSRYRNSLIGIVSYGGKDCGMPGIPAVYTKVTGYLLWILDHLEP